MKLNQFVKSAFWSSMTELKIMTCYAIWPSLMIKILSLVNWDYETLVSIIKFFVFIRIAYHEDSKTLTQPGVVLLVRLLVVGTVFFSLQYAIDYSTEKGSNVGGDATFSMKWKWRQETTSWFNYDKSALFAWKLVGEYLKFVSSLANYRLVFVGMTLSLFVFVEVLSWLASGDPTDDF